MFNIGNSYNFTTLAPALLGADYASMRVVAIVGAEEAIKYGDITSKHEAVKAVIAGLPDSPSTLTYVVFKNSDGESLVLAVDYIDPTTIVVVTTVTMDIKIFDVSSSMEQVIKLRLRELGINNFTVTTS